jgi:hypothetical protein
MIKPVDIKQWQAEGEALATGANANSWAQADWLTKAERVGDSKYKLAAQILKFSIGNCKNMVVVAKTYPPDKRHVNVTFTHYATVAALPEDERELLLALAAEKGLSVAKLRAEVQKLHGNVKAKEPRFILDGLPDYSRNVLTGRAFKTDVSLVDYVLKVIDAHIHSEVSLPRFEAQYLAWVNHDFARLRRIPLLSSEVIHAHDWKERTDERCRRLLAIVQPARAEGLTGFVNAFEQIYGADKMPLQWMIGRHSQKRKGQVLNAKALARYQPTVGCGKLMTFKDDAPTPADCGHPDYTDAEEERRIAVLKAEQKVIEDSNAQLYMWSGGRKPPIRFHYGMVMHDDGWNGIVQVQASALRNVGKDDKHYWLTPPELYAQLDAEFHFDFDPCPYPLPEGFDGLGCEWGLCNYVNPPFSATVQPNGKKAGPTAWLKKAIEEQSKGKTTVIVFPQYAFTISAAKAAEAEIRNLGQVKWLATEDGTRMHTGLNSPIALWVLRGKAVEQPAAPTVVEPQVQEAAA